MKKTLLLPLVVVASSPVALAVQPDTVNVRRMELDKVTVVGFKQNQPDRAPLSASVFNGNFLSNNEISGVKEFTGIVPNFYMPDYGSKQNTPIYIRGIGSKINAPSIGFYVDGVPYFENSAFDIDIADVSNVEVLRGPQGSLFGRNAIGGIVSVYTRSPLDYQGTRIKVGTGNYNDVQAGVSNFTKVNSRFGFSIAGDYHHNDGYFTNIYLGKKSDNINNGSGRIGFVWRPTDQWTLRLNSLLDYSKQGGYPYGIYDTNTGTVADVNYDSRSTYRRLLSTSGFNARYEGRNVSFNSQTAYQFLRDRQGIDQDFTTAHTYFVENRTKQSMYSQEFTLKSKEGRRYHWIVGAFGFYQYIDKTVETSYFTKNISTPKSYQVPTYGVAVYHQSTLDIWRGLSASVGLRYDYEHAKNEYTPYTKSLKTGEATVAKGAFNNQLHFSQLTPRFSLQYMTRTRQLVYAAVSRGYKTGGFNTTFKTEDEQTFKPEYNWNYEVGTKLSFLDNRLNADVSVFYIDWRDQQISQTIPGVGNIQRNAGHSQSKGFELALTAVPVKGLTLQMNYGFTYARFLKYEKDTTTNYNKKFLPLVPRHTFTLAANYTLVRPCSAIDRLTLSGNVTGIGPIYWRETNTEKQKFYALLNLKVSATKGLFTWEIWGKNLTSTKYLSYYFMATSPAAQQGKPLTFGTSLILNLK